MIKGLFSGVGSLIIGLILRENIDNYMFVIYALVLGFVSYGLSIFFYILAQKGLGAAKTSAFYAINPFVGSLLSVVILKEELKWNYYVAFGVMLIGAIIIVIDTLKLTHIHEHSHEITYYESGQKYTKIITHTHSHTHYLALNNHMHYHVDK